MGVMGGRPISGVLLGIVLALAGVAGAGTEQGAAQNRHTGLWAHELARQCRSGRISICDRLLEMRFVETQFAEGIAVDEMRENVVAYRRGLGERRQTFSTANWNVDAQTKNLLQLGGRLTSQALPRLAGLGILAGGWGGEAAELFIGGYESWVGEERVLEEFEKYKQDMDVLHDMLSAPENLDNSVGDLYRSNPTAAQVIDDTVGPDLEFNPGSSDQEVLAASRELRRDDSIREVLETLEDDTRIATKNRRLLEIANSKLGAVVSELEAMRDRARAEVMETATFRQRQRERWAVSEEIRRRELASETNAANSRAVLGLVANFLEIGGEPRASRFVRATSTAVFDIRDSLKAYEVARGLGDSGAMQELAVAGLTANVAAVALSFAGALMDRGPSAEEVMLQQLAELQRAVERVRREMHERFDRVSPAFGRDLQGHGEVVHGFGRTKRGGA